jgi:hypothetical protein
MNLNQPNSLYQLVDLCTKDDRERISLKLRFGCDGRKIRREGGRRRRRRGTGHLANGRVPWKRFQVRHQISFFLNQNGRMNILGILCNNSHQAPSIQHE